MTNHPNRSRQARSRINLLICKVVDGRRDITRTFTGISVIVRYGYSPMEHSFPEVAGKRIAIHLAFPTKFDRSVVNNSGQLGASVVEVDVERIADAVARLRAEWGDVPVQDNSGRCAHLATAPGVLII